ncbi:MAG TPA: hypothetical protein VKA73_11725 [Rubrobacter sp.]|nr:hypothetical protein [Rubrobacter sp.]
MPRDGYALPEDLDRHAPNRRFAPEGLREACRSAGEGLGAEDARLARFRPAAEIVGMWRGLDLPAWASPTSSGTPAPAGGALEAEAGSRPQEGLGR